MKRILINATHNEEIRVALCKDNHLYDFDLENRTREQKKANIYKGHITRVEPSLEAAFVEYGSARQGFLPLREIAPEYLHGNAREDSIRQLLKEGDEVIVQVEKEERGNKGAALSTYISLAGRYLVLMPNNAKAGGISRQISGKVREEMKQIIASLSIPKGMSVIVRTAGLGKGFDDLQNDLNHLLDIWTSIQDQNKKRPSPCLVHQEAGVVTRAVRDYLRDDISEVWIDSEHAYNEAANFIAAVMPTQLDKLRKYTEYEPMFARFGIERQIETAYQREVRLPSGGSIVIDQTEAMVAIDINSSKSTKGSDVAETAYHTNLEAADEIARQLRLRDMGGLIVIDFIDMNDPRHQKDVEKRLIDATRHDRARVQFAEISKFGLMEMSRQRLRPSLEESTGYICPRCHGNGMIRDLRSLALSIMRQIEQIALKERMGEIQAEVPTEIAAFLLNEKRESLVYLEQDSGTRITILPHAHLESPNFSLHFNPDGFAPSSYERIVNAEEEEMGDRGYDVNWHTENEQPESINKDAPNRWQKANSAEQKHEKAQDKPVNTAKAEPQVAAWLSNLFAPKPQAKLAGALDNSSAAAAIESIVNAGGVSLGASGVANLVQNTETKTDNKKAKEERPAAKPERESRDEHQERRHKNKKAKKESVEEVKEKTDKKAKKEEPTHQKREAGSQRAPRGEVVRGAPLTNDHAKADKKPDETTHKKADKERARPSNPNEVVVSVTPIAKEEVTSQTVHISLDGSKTAKPDNADTKVDDHVNNVDADSINIDGADVDGVDVNETNKTATKGKSDDANASNKPSNDKAADASDAQNAKPQSETEEPSLAAQSDAPSAPAILHEATDDQNDITDAPQEQTAAQADESADIAKTDEAANDASDINVPLSSLLSPTIAPSAQIIELARQENRAVNDPRVVMQAQSTQPVIRGTAREFIELMLGDTQRGDFIQDFINACAKNQAPSANLDFANYGHAPLSDAYLRVFDRHTSVTARISAPQGKTAAPALRTTERAINDPRGPRSDLPTDEQNAQAGKAESVAEQALAAQTADHTADASAATDVATNADTKDVAVPTETLTTQNTKEPQSTSADSDSSETLIEQIKDGLESAIDAISDTVNELFGDDDSADVIDTDEPAKSEHKTAKASSDKKTAKRTNSYKDMIENVAGQLLPQVGILNLAQPKPAKTRIKKTAGKSDNKPKSEVRKAGAKVVKNKTEKADKALDDSATE
ncbi:Rne/Rng family ribonuclease [Moraxella nasibovis]|uniref:Rne/Rng family ribonuclease n=1 Tax=Moraxella nasibovis TaxID=2904120 RepID=UPI0024109CA2|nr:Rne/Rng family ribonuclease [Moraxella nasibovis]WFF38461.1 Rne/Rng family ribonuclease [Moraxella nasibovis]